MSFTTIRYCNQCFQYLTPNNIPKSHASHSKDFNAVVTHCPVCKQNIVDGVSNFHHDQHLEREAQVRRKQEAMKKQQVTNKILDRGNFIPLGVGSFVESEQIVKKIARDKIK